MDTIKIRRVGFTSLFKILSIGLVSFLVPFCFLAGILASFGMESLHWNDEPVTGPIALIAGPAMGLFLGLMFSIILTTWIWLGLLISSRFFGFNIRYTKFGD